MKLKLKPTLALCAALAGLCAISYVRAQQPTANSADGTVAQYLMNPRGDVDGLLLTDNTIVRFPPHLSAALTSAIKPQASVKVTGFSAVKGVIEATTITDKASGKSVTNTPPTPGNPPPPPASDALQQISVSGTIKVLLHAPRGEVDGVILNDGSIVHFGPANGTQFASLLEVGKPLAAIGNGTANSFGKSLEATSLGASASSMQTVMAPPPRRKRGPAGAPPPPPPGD